MLLRFRIVVVVDESAMVSYVVSFFPCLVLEWLLGVSLWIEARFVNYCARWVAVVAVHSPSTTKDAWYKLPNVYSPHTFGLYFLGEESYHGGPAGLRLWS